MTPISYIDETLRSGFQIPWWMPLIVGIYVSSAVLEYRSIRLTVSHSEDSSSRLKRRLRDAMEVVYVPSKDTNDDEHTRIWLVLGTIGGLGSAIAVSWIAEARVPSDACHLAQGIGIATAACGAALRFKSVRALGPAAIRVVHADSRLKLVTEGPFRFIRNPAYAGSLLMYLGLGVSLCSWLSAFLAFTVPLFSRVPRILREEKILLLVYGEEYSKYHSRTKRLIPGIW